MFELRVLAWFPPVVIMIIQNPLFYYNYFNFFFPVLKGIQDVGNCKVHDLCKVHREGYVMGSLAFMWRSLPLSLFLLVCTREMRFWHAFTLNGSCYFLVVSSHSWKSACYFRMIDSRVDGSHRTTYDPQRTVR